MKNSRQILLGYSLQSSFWLPVSVSVQILMEIVKCVKVIVPRLSSIKKVLRNKLWHMLPGKNTGASAFGGFSPASPPANFACLRQDTSSLVMGSGAEPRPKTVLVKFNLLRSSLVTANSSPVSWKVGVWY